MSWYDDGPTPRWSAAENEWFACVLKRGLRDAVYEAAQRGPFPYDLLFPKVIAHYLKLPGNYVAWTDSDIYQGGWDGTWVIEWFHVIQSLPQALRDARRELHREGDGSRYPTLDAWLAAEVAGDLKSKPAYEHNGHFCWSNAPRRSRKRPVPTREPWNASAPTNGAAAPSVPVAGNGGSHEALASVPATPTRAPTDTTRETALCGMWRGLPASTVVQSDVRTVPGRASLPLPVWSGIHGPWP